MVNMRRNYVKLKTQGCHLWAIDIQERDNLIEFEELETDYMARDYPQLLFCDISLIVIYINCSH